MKLEFCNIPTQKYKHVKTLYAPKGGALPEYCCDNCNRPISNIVIIKGQKDLRTYHIGTECIKSVIKHNKLTELELIMLEETKKLNREKKLKRFIMKQRPSLVLGEKNHSIYSNLDNISPEYIINKDYYELNIKGLESYFSKIITKKEKEALENKVMTCNQCLRKHCKSFNREYIEFNQLPKETQAKVLNRLKPLGKEHPFYKEIEYHCYNKEGYITII